MSMPSQLTAWKQTNFETIESETSGHQPTLVALGSNLRWRVTQYPWGMYLTLEFLSFQVKNCREIWAGRVP